MKLSTKRLAILDLCLAFKTNTEPKKEFRIMYGFDTCNMRINARNTCFSIIKNRIQLISKSCTYHTSHAIDSTGDTENVSKSRNIIPFFPSPAPFFHLSLRCSFLLLLLFFHFRWLKKKKNTLAWRVQDSVREMKCLWPWSYDQIFHPYYGSVPYSGEAPRLAPPSQLEGSEWVCFDYSA